MFVIKTKKSVEGMSCPWLHLCGRVYRRWLFTLGHVMTYPCHVSPCHYVMIIFHEVNHLQKLRYAPYSTCHSIV